MNIYKKIFLLLFCLSCLVGCDLGTKKLAEQELKGNAKKSYLGGSLNLVYVENSGGMLSIGDDLPHEIRFIIFRVIVGFMLGGLLVYTILKKNLLKIQLAFLIMILAGGIGNLYDRITNDGNVIDFVFLQLFGLRTGVFNIADVYVTIGVGLLLLSVSLKRYADSEIEY